MVKEFIKEDCFLAITVGHVPNLFIIFVVTTIKN